MSVAEETEVRDTELRDLVSQTLEKNGILAKIRAELRASVFLALEGQSQENNPHFINNALKDYLTKAESALGLCLVREFLEYLQLDNTLAVFNTETHHGEDYEYKGRSMLIKDLHLEKFKERRGPLLSTIIEIAQDSIGSVSPAAHRTEEHGGDFVTNRTSSPRPSMPSNLSYSDTSSASLDNSLKPLNATFTTGTVLITSFGSPEASLDKQPMEAVNLTSKITTEGTNSKQDFTSEEANGDINQARGFSESRHGFETGDAKNSPSKEKSAHSTFTNPQTSLSNLPPLTEMKGGKNTASVQKSLFSALTAGGDDNYEDDFSSESSGAGDRVSRGKSGRSIEKKDIDSAFGKTSPKELNSPAASVSEELEGEGNSVTDDVNSAASADTLDSSLSNQDTKIADHMEGY